MRLFRTAAAAIAISAVTIGAPQANADDHDNAKANEAYYYS